MSREIKFRAWINGGEATNFVHVMTHDLSFEECAPINDLLNGVNKWGALMQYTGLKDVNGKEIFEGDIVHWGHIKGYEEMTPRKAVVEFSPELAFMTFNLERNHRFGFSNFIYKYTDKALEVIGNIYEHPHLLEDRR